MKKTIMIMVIIFLPSLVNAEPIYLDCFVQTEGEKKQTFSVKLDESTGKITHNKDSGLSFNTEGFYSPKTISYHNISVHGDLSVTYKYTIDRTNLKVKEIFKAVPNDPRSNVSGIFEERTGICEVVKLKELKI